MNYLIPALLLSLTAFSAFAADQPQQRWMVIGTNQRMTAQVDVSSIKRLSDGGVQVWARVKYRAPQIARSGKEYDQLDRLSVYNCEEKTRRPVQLIMYRNGEVVDSERAGEYIIPILPDTTAHTTLTWACSQTIASAGTQVPVGYRRR